jgi:hypothetical protein
MSDSCKVLNNGDSYKDIRCNINENFDLLEKKIEEQGGAAKIVKTSLREYKELEVKNEDTLYICDNGYLFYGNSIVGYTSVEGITEAELLDNVEFPCTIQEFQYNYGYTSMNYCINIDKNKITDLPESSGTLFCRVSNSGGNFVCVFVGASGKYYILNKENKFFAINTVYTKLSDIGLTAPTTVLEISQALKVGERLELFCTSAEITDLTDDVSEGTLYVHRVNEITWNIEYIYCEMHYYGWIYNNSVQWYTNALHDDLMYTYTNISKLGLTAPCTSADILNKLNPNTAFKANMTTSNVTDLPDDGTLYIECNVSGKPEMKLTSSTDIYEGIYLGGGVDWHKYVFEDKIVTQINDTSKNDEIPTAWAVKDLVANKLFEVVGTGELDSHAGEQTTTRYIHNGARGLFLVAIHNTSIPEDGYWFFMSQGQSGELHRIAGDDVYSKVTCGAGLIDGAFRVYLDFYSNEASKMVYQIYKLPFFGE